MAARADLQSRVGSHLEALFGLTSADTLVLESERAFQTGIEESLADVHVWHYRREHAGLPVFGDRHSLTIRTSDWCPDGWVAFLSASWERDLAAVSQQPLITEPQAVAAAQLSGEVPGGTPTQPVVLELHTLTPQPLLVYEVWLGNGVQRWLYHVSATTGAVVAKGDQVAKYDGTLQIYVGRPHEGTAKYPRPLPYATIYEDAEFEAGAPYSCYSSTMNQYNGDDAQILGETSYQGTYANLWPGQSGDLWWVVDYRGSYGHDRSEEFHLDLDFYANQTWTFPQMMGYDQSRRGEVFYLLNYGARVYAAYGVDQFKPLDFDYIEYNGGSSCNNPTFATDCCIGTSGGGCFYIECDGDFDIVASALAERRFREVVFHEQNHELRWKVSGSLCSGSNECAAWEEGRADFGAVSLSRFEKARPEYKPDKLYPDDYVGDNYHKGAIWTAIYAHFLQHTGPNHGIRTVNDTIVDADSNTVMVGSCSDSDQDGCIEVYDGECPPNSFHRHLLDSDRALYTGKVQDQATISEVFHYHVTDADPGSPGTQTFPWVDEMPNRLEVPPFAALELGAQIGVTEGPDPTSGSLRFDVSDDYDTVMFLGRGGESYYIETTGLASGVDTYLEVLDAPAPWGRETVLARNDNCGASPRSCLTFAPNESAYYRIRVSPTISSQVGCDKTYQLWITMRKDDYGDDFPGSAALAADGASRQAALATLGDIDVFKIASSATQSLRYRGCSTTLTSLLVEVLDSGGTLIDSSNNTSCTAPDETVSIGQGVYFLRVSSPLGQTGGYEIRATLATDIDIDSTAANAWTLSGEATTGRVVGSRFETGADAEDWYTFTASGEGEWLMIETFGLGGSVNTILELYTPSGTLYGRTGTLDSLPDTSGGNGLGHWMLRDDDGALFNKGSRIAFITPVAGTYYARVLNAWSTQGPYYVAFEPVGTVAGTMWLPYP